MKYLMGIIGVLLIVFSISILTELAVYPLAVLIIGVVAGLMIGFMVTIAQKEKLLMYKRQLERISVINDKDASKVEVLEAKIKTLEAALKRALEN